GSPVASPWQCRSGPRSRRQSPVRRGPAHLDSRGKFGKQTEGRFRHFSLISTTQATIFMPPALEIGRASCRERVELLAAAAAGDRIRGKLVTGVQTCALPIWDRPLLPPGSVDQGHGAVASPQSAAAPPTSTAGGSLVNKRKGGFDTSR